MRARVIIHNEIVNIDPDLKETLHQSTEKWCVSKVQLIQNLIQDLGNAVSYAVLLLSHLNDEIVCEVLAFLEAMLYSGGKTVHYNGQSTQECNHHIQSEVGTGRYDGKTW